MRRIGVMSAVALSMCVACGATKRDAAVAQGGNQPGKNQIAEGDPNAQDDSEWGILGDSDYPTTVQKVVGMVEDPEVTAGAERRGLSVVNVMWEDTGRAQGSSLGPNISDLTLQVRYKQAGDDHETTALMPVIRFPNFSDRTGDVPASKFFVRAGNHKNKKGLSTVPLTDVLRDIKKYASRPWSIIGSGNLLAPRDSHFLVSAQAVFLPIPKKGKAEFNPVVFNYQSAPGSPAVLAILVTRQGTSMTVVENRPEDRSLSGWGQELYFNNEGLRAAFTAERRTDVVKRIAAQGGPKSADDKSALAHGADALFLIQIPLKHANRGVLGGPMDKGEMADEEAGPPPPMAAPAPATAAGGGMASAAMKEKSNVEQAVLGHGKSRGPFEEGANLRLERDDRFPIRITVQFYKATSNGVADDKDLDAIARNIGSVYEHASFVGSLVVPEGDRLRPTEWQKIPNQWFPW